MQNHELDRAWIVDAVPEIDENGINAFQQKVAELTVDYGYKEDKARLEILFIMTGRPF